MEEREVEEAECLGESIGEPMAVEGEETSVSVVEVMVRRRAGCCWGVTPVEVAAAITTFFFLLFLFSFSSPLFQLLSLLHYLTA